MVYRSRKLAERLRIPNTTAQQSTAQHNTPRDRVTHLCVCVGVCVFGFNAEWCNNSCCAFVRSVSAADAPGASSEMAAIYVQSWRCQGLQRKGVRKAAGSTLRACGKESLGVREYYYVIHMNIYVQQ